MGQAWTVALSWKKDHRTLYGGYDVDMVETYFAHDYVYEWTDEQGRVSKHINGYKLMETSYVGNQMVNDVVRGLIGHRDDHPMLTWVGEYTEYAEDEHINDLIRMVNNPFEHSIRHEAVQDANPPKVWILCPDLGQYVRYDPGKDRGEIAAIALLCAFGNGLGGGDYSGTAMELVGKWVGHELRVCDTEPEGEDLTGMFKEE